MLKGRSSAMVALEGRLRRESALPMFIFIFILARHIQSICGAAFRASVTIRVKAGAMFCHVG